MTSNTIILITLAQWRVNNKYLACASTKLFERVIANSLYNFAQVLNGNFAAFGITNDAMIADERSVLTNYASRVKTLAQSVGVRFTEDGTIKNKGHKNELPTLVEFNEMLLAAFTMKKEKQDYDFEAALSRFLKTADREGHDIDEIIDAISASRRAVLAEAA